MDFDRSLFARWTAGVALWLRRLAPSALGTSPRERLRAIVGTLLGVLCAAVLSHLVSPTSPVWLIAPVGASAVLVFTAPASPLAQPWSVIAGNTFSALVGLCCALGLPGPLFAASVAVPLAVAVMMFLRCLHPPGGAVALLVVLAHEPSWGFALFPVLTNSVLLVLVGMLYNSWSGHPYPYKGASSAVPDVSGTARIDRADMDTALAQYDQVLDVAPDELIRLLRRAEGAAYERLWGTLMCSDLMTPDPETVDFRTPLDQAWAHMQRLQIKAMPVIDQSRHVVGIISRADLLRTAYRDVPMWGAADTRAQPIPESARPQTVGEIMTRQVRVASASSHALDLLPLFSAAGHHHLPVIDEERRLVGILTQTDLVRALSRVVRAV
jgi:CBS domain-containing membrane protein